MSKAINAAYEVLSDETKRIAYDAKILREERNEQQKTQRQYTASKQTENHQ
jgi:curved DNA-binding protein CbpA